jgi:hypothetical protein
MQLTHGVNGQDNRVQAMVNHSWPKHVTASQQWPHADINQYKLRARTYPTA